MLFLERFAEVRQRGLDVAIVVEAKLADQLELHPVAEVEAVGGREPEVGVEADRRRVIGLGAGQGAGRARRARLVAGRASCAEDRGYRRITAGSALPGPVLFAAQR